MTRSGYLFANFLKFLGFPFTKHRLQNAASELQLLRESEMILGFYVWENAHDLEQFSQESNTIKAFLEKKEALSTEVTSWKKRVAKASHSNGQPKTLKKSSRQQLIAQHHNIAARADSIINKSEKIIEEAKEVRQNFDKLNTSIQTMKSKHDPSHLIKEKEEELSQIKLKFNQLKSARQKNDQTLAVYSQKLEDLESQIQAANELDETTENTEKYHTIGQANHTISNLQLQISNLDSKLNEHYALIGKQISKEYFTDKNCRKAIKNKSTLVNIMAALRKSIEFNHHIAGR